ncbi:MAG: alpha/beta hydrolase [Erysipelotrichaceae bacterium]|nr:alpha/beta hydrolase [Erysipelotrichaceae bacterium]
MKWIIIILAVITVLLFAAGFRMADTTMSIKPQTLEEAREWQQEHGDISWYDNVEKTDYTVSSYDGYVLHVQLISNPEKSSKYVLISHGYTDNRIGSLKYADIYLDLGFNVIVYDLRGHGLNEKTYCSYSVREAKDLNALIEDSRERYPDADVFGLHGESLGAATSISCLQYKPDVDFVVSDCGFSDISGVLKGGLKMMHMPRFLVDVAGICAGIKYGIPFSQMKPIEALKENEIPILFMHGAVDRFIKPENSEEMQKTTKGYSELHLIKDADHAASVFTDHESYAEYVKEFLKTLNLL